MKSPFRPTSDGSNITDWYYAPSYEEALRFLQRLARSQDGIRNLRRVLWELDSAERVSDFNDVEVIELLAIYLTNGTILVWELPTIIPTVALREEKKRQMMWTGAQTTSFKLEMLDSLDSLQDSVASNKLDHDRNDEQKEISVEHSLSESEREAIVAYIRSSSMFNDIARGVELTSQNRDRYEEYTAQYGKNPIIELDSALNKFPPEPGITYRGISVEIGSEYQKKLEALKLGDVYSDKGFFSTSRYSLTTSVFMAGNKKKENNHYFAFVVEGFSGVFVTRYGDESTASYDQEILFRTNTEFTVVKIEEETAPSTLEPFVQEDGSIIFKQKRNPRRTTIHLKEKTTP